MLKGAKVQDEKSKYKGAKRYIVQRYKMKLSNMNRPKMNGPEVKRTKLKGKAF